jgi:hypothetical protein
MTDIQFQGGLSMVAQRELQHMTVDEWRGLERTSHDIKHEYIDGRVYAMSGGSLGVRFPLAALYKNAGVLEAMEDPEGEV